MNSGEQIGLELLNKLAEVKYWSAIENSYLPGAIRSWNALSKVDTIVEFEVGLQKLREEIKEQDEED